MSFVPEPEWVDEDTPEPPCLEVDITEAQVVAVLYGPDGVPLIELYDREIIDFGFQPGQT